MGKLEPRMGAEIAISASAHKCIAQITRKRSKVMRLTLRRKQANIPIQIQPTYAPHSGRAVGGRKQNRQEVKEITNKTWKRGTIICCADANGQRGRKDEEGKPTTATPNKTLLRHITEQQRPKKGNGAQLRRTCYHQKMITMTTWKITRIEKGQMGKYMHCENMGIEIWEGVGSGGNASASGPSQMARYDGKLTTL